MNILLLGGTGQIGHALHRTLLPLGRITAPTRAQADLADLDGLRTYLQAQTADLIVNAAAFTAVDAAQTDPALAQCINADAVALLAEHARLQGAVLVHYSTDYVFDGNKPVPYTEDDTPNPLNVYGRTKLAGEQAIHVSGCAALVLRTSWVYAAHGHNFVKTILRLARQRDELSVVADQIGCPTSAELAADVTAMAVAAQRRRHLPDGLYHLSAAGAASWHDLACHVVRCGHELGMSLRLRPEHIRAIDTASYPLPAPRPRNSRLDTQRLADALGLQLPDWTLHLDRTLDCLVRRETPPPGSP